MVLIASLVVVLLVLLNGLFSMSELAVVSARRARLRSRAEQGERGAAAALKLAGDPTSFLSSVQVGITLIGILSGAYGQATIAQALALRLEDIPLVAPYSRPIATGVVVLVITYLSIVIGELVPKRIALLFPELIASVMARPLVAVAKALTPFITLLTVSTIGILRLLGLRDHRGSIITHEEVETVLAEGTRAGLIEPAEQAMIGEVLQLGDRPVRAAMTHRRYVYWVSLEDPEEQIRAEIRDCPYSRVVISKGQDIESPLGVVHKKDVLDAVLTSGTFALADLVKTPLFVPETASLLQAMELFKGTPVHMAFVVDEFGVFQGVVTATDLLETIAGDFPEAHDKGDEHSMVRRQDGTWLVDGRVSVSDLSETLDEKFGTSRAFDTAAGLVLHHLAHIPTEGESVRIGAYDVEVVDMDERRIDKLLFTRVGPH
jgi:putative hemolysin